MSWQNKNLHMDVLNLKYLATKRGNVFIIPDWYTTAMGAPQILNNNCLYIEHLPFVREWSNALPILFPREASYCPSFIDENTRVNKVAMWKQWGNKHDSTVISRQGFQPALKAHSSTTLPYNLTCVGWIW